MRETLLRYARAAARFLEARSPEERRKRAADGLALLLVAAVAVVKSVTGVSDSDAPFGFYAVAIAAASARGGFQPGVVATLASLLAAGLAASSLGLQARVLFAAEGLALALVVAAVKSRLQARDARLAAAREAVAGLRRRDRDGRRLDAALRHLEAVTADSAVVVLDDRGLVKEWRDGAERLYGYAQEDLVGAPGSSLFFESLSPGEYSRLLHETAQSGLVRRADVHRRRDGSRVEVELEIKRFRDGDARGFTVAVHDLARRREWEEYRRAAARAQAGLQQAADDTRQQLAALESLTDPSLNPFGGDAEVTELLERLRAAVRADAVALVQHGAGAAAVVAARDLQPSSTAPAAAESLRLAPGRVAVVHNDPGQVARLSALGWPATVASLLVVPVVHDGRVWSTIEVAGERSRQVSDWDVALARVVADRLAAVVARRRGLAA